LSSRHRQVAPDRRAVDNVLLDGEAVAFRPDGHSDAKTGDGMPHRAIVAGAVDDWRGIVGEDTGDRREVAGRVYGGPINLQQV
jgi:hypothetical protein